MPRIINENELSVIIKTLSKYPSATISQLDSQLPIKLNHRTLQRRLALLVSQKKIIVLGSRTDRRYQLAATATSTEETHQIALSSESKMILETIKRPLTQRIPVAYQTDFLFSYRPNETFYLSEATRAHLWKIGRQFHKELEPGTYAKRILHRLLIDLSWNSSRLEGNTYSLLETEKLIEFGAESEGKQAFEAQMIMNHKEAIEFMVEQVAHFGLTKHILFSIHALLSNNLLPNPHARGKLRKIPVGIGKTVYHPPEIPQLIEECFETIINTAKKIKDPFEQAFFLMVQLPYLQPFEDINKRVSRLASNIPLIEHNLSPLSFIDVPQKEYINGLLGVYELNKTELLRDVFVWAYERSAQHYKLVQDTLMAPNLIVMRYKKLLFDLVNHIVINNIRGKKIISLIEQWTLQQVEKKYQREFIQQAEKEIASLHEGNIAIYRISADVFSKWNRK